MLLDSGEGDWDFLADLLEEDLAGEEARKAGSIELRMALLFVSFIKFACFEARDLGWVLEGRLPPRIRLVDS